MTAPTIWSPVPDGSTGAGQPPPLNGSAVADSSGTATVSLTANPQRDIWVMYLACSAIGSASTTSAVIVYDAVVAESGYFDSGDLIKPGPATVGWYVPSRLIPAGHAIIAVFSGLNQGDMVNVRVEYVG